MSSDYPVHRFKNVNHYKFITGLKVVVPADFLPSAKVVVKKRRTVLSRTEKSLEFRKIYSAVVEYKARQVLKRT